MNKYAIWPWTSLQALIKTISSNNISQKKINANKVFPMQVLPVFLFFYP